MNLETFRTVVASALSAIAVAAWAQAAVALARLLTGAAS